MNTHQKCSALLIFSAAACSPNFRNATALSMLLASVLNRCRGSAAFATATTVRMARPRQFGYHSQRDLTLRMTDSESNSSEEESEIIGMYNNIYQPWSIADDYYLYKFQKEPIPKLASKLGRGLVGVRNRLKKLNDVNSLAYERLFTSSGKQRQMLASLITAGEKDIQPSDFNFGINYIGGNDYSTSSASNRDQHKLTAVKEVLRRIQWDATLTPSDFLVCYYDRVADKILSVPFTHPNSSVDGKQELFALAIPEHRIVSIKYRDRVVWDKAARLDYICGSGKRDDDDKTTTIHDVIDTYQEWQRLNDEIKELCLIRQRTAVSKVKKFLGEDRFSILRQSSDELRRAQGDRHNENENKVAQIKNYVKTSFALFEQARKENTGTIATSLSSAADYIGSTSKDQLDSSEELFSELVSTLPDTDLCEAILLEISNIAGRFSNKKPPSEQTPIVVLREEDLTETFTKGGGAGGQKINKTSNRVILIHNPTQISVSVQETRSLQQNRKIARKRLLEKVDIYMHGSNSKFAIKAMKDTENKIKAKARRKARQKKRLDQPESKLHEEEEEEEKDDDDYSFRNSGTDIDLIKSNES